MKVGNQTSQKPKILSAQCHARPLKCYPQMKLSLRQNLISRKEKLSFLMQQKRFYILFLTALLLVLVHHINLHLLFGRCKVTEPFFIRFNIVVDHNISPFFILTFQS